MPPHYLQLDRNRCGNTGVVLIIHQLKVFILVIENRRLLRLNNQLRVRVRFARRGGGAPRLWYAFFLPTAGLIVYSRWRYPWILAFSNVLAGVFTTVNIVNPDIHNKTLMPALQSPWFAPHVIVYMFAYAVLGAAALMSAYLLWFKKSPINEHEMDICDNLVQVGWAFMTVGILFGALWAKEAWGHYWAWDPKETWAAATWFAYLAYIHVRIRSDRYRRAALWGLFISFILLQMCWWGINYLPSAQGVSVHTYSLG